MKAAIYKKYGPPEVLHIEEIDKPHPAENEILVKIHNATVTSGDARLRASDFPPIFWLAARLIFGLFKPKKQILGHEFAGVVEAVGIQVKNFKIGDRVFGTTTMLSAGSYAEYVCVPEKWKNGVVEQMPSNLQFKEAAAIPIGGMTALFLLKKAGLGSGQRVLIYGASGSVGSFAVQIARIMGATVTGVCSEKNKEMVHSLGAETVIDYKTKDFSQQKETYDVILDAVGKISKSKASKALKSGGSFVSVRMLTKETPEGLAQLKTWAEEGKLHAFIDKTFTLEQIVEAHKHVDSGRKRGNVLIKIAEDTP